MFRQAWIVGVGVREAKSQSPNKDIFLAMAQDEKTGTIQYEMAIANQQAFERGKQ